MNNSELNNNSNIKKKIRLTPQGYVKYLKKIKTARWLFRQGKLLNELSEKSWQMAPSSTSIVTKAFCLDNQLKRVTGTAVTGKPERLMAGGNQITHAPVMAYQLKKVWMINGNLYHGLNQFLMHPRYQLTTKMDFFPPVKINTEINNATIYNSFDGYKAFGIWLSDDCTMYKLAASEGTPVTSNIFTSPHMRDYRTLLNINPVKTNAALLKNVIFFDDDWGNGASKHKRFAENRGTLLSKFNSKNHPGTFILRRNSGNSRTMINEEEIAYKLQDDYGFKIVDVTQNSVDEILSACAGSQMLIGVEGSHLMHGLMVMQPNTSILTLQPPDRFCGVLKMTTDMEHIHYGFVVGTPKENGFYLDYNEIQKTIDLMPKN